VTAFVVPSRRGLGARLVRALHVQRDLWDRLLWQPELSGTEARALVGDPPLRWSGDRLRGSVLPFPAEQPGRPPRR
jgi:hypothetical protein